MKKVISILTIVLCLSLIGCSNKTDKTEQTTTSKKIQEEITKEVPKEEKTVKTEETKTEEEWKVDGLFMTSGAIYNDKNIINFGTIETKDIKQLKFEIIYKDENGTQLSKIEKVYDVNIPYVENQKKIEGMEFIAPKYEGTEQVSKVVFNLLGYK